MKSNSNPEKRNSKLSINVNIFEVAQRMSNLSTLILYPMAKHTVYVVVVKNGNE